MYYKQPLERVSIHWKITIFDPQHELPRGLNILYRTVITGNPLTAAMTDGPIRSLRILVVEELVFVQLSCILQATYSLIAMYLTIQASTLLRSSLL